MEVPARATGERQHRATPDKRWSELRDRTPVWAGDAMFLGERGIDQKRHGRGIETGNLDRRLSRRVTEYDAVVYDLDGTLVHLAVDWATVRDEVAAALAERDVAVDDESLWGLLERADETGHREQVEAVITEHERVGARDSDRLPTAAELVDRAADVPVGVCSLNSEAACHVALQVHDLDSHVTAVVGRDTVSTEKPDPEPLLATVRGLSAEPSRTVFVGDTERDRETATRAGVAFRWVEG